MWGYDTYRNNQIIAAKNQNIVAAFWLTILAAGAAVLFFAPPPPPKPITEYHISQGDRTIIAESCRTHWISGRITARTAGGTVELHPSGGAISIKEVTR